MTAMATTRHSSSGPTQRWPELRALFRWIIHSWYRSANSETLWEQ